MDTANFLTVESGKDLILAFAVVDPDDPTQIESLILQRTPLYEPLLEEHERGVKVSFERFSADEEDRLIGVHWHEDARIIRIETQLRTYNLDLRKIDSSSLKSMRRVLKQMNYDESFRLSEV